MPKRLNNLATSFHAQYERTGDMQDLHTAIVHSQRALELTPHYHPGMPRRLRILGISLQSRSERTGEIQDLDDAVTHMQGALDLTPQDHLDMPIWLSSLGTLLWARHQHTVDVDDLGRAIAAFQRSVAAPHGSILAKFNAARYWTELARSVPHLTPSSCIQAYSEAIALLPGWVNPRLSGKSC